MRRTLSCRNIRQTRCPDGAQPAGYRPVCPAGSYRYDAAKNTLVQLGSEDLRPILAKEQKFAGDAPVHLLFVTKDKKYGEMHAGSMYQNASLYCASAGLKCVVRGLYDRAEIKQALGLDGDYEVVMTEAAGYPKAQ